jgi:conjugative relaxase-like TrwC/TraI family protein
MHHGCVADVNEGGEGSGGVVADIAKLSVGREEYYTRELASDHEAYLSGHGESPGRWYGAGATSLGLQGEASVAGFQAMFVGRDPTTDEVLGRPHGPNAVPAFDVVLRPTKSVSILYGLGDAATGRAVLQAHHAGLAEAVAYLDGHLGARRGHGGIQHVSGQGLLAVGFDHRTSREGDPLLHTHLVIANRVQGPDGRWTALDGRDLYRHRLAVDAIYRASYQRELSRSLGVEWTVADVHGNRELQGVPEELLRAFSKRAGQIDLEVERLEASGRERTPRLVKWAVHATRKAKEHETPDTLYVRWRTEAAERGVDPDALVRQVTDRTRDRDPNRTVSERTVAVMFDRLASPDGLTVTASSFARQDVIAALGAELAGATRAERPPRQPSSTACSTPPRSDRSSPLRRPSWWSRRTGPGSEWPSTARRSPWRRPRSSGSVARSTCGGRAGAGVEAAHGRQDHPPAAQFESLSRPALHVRWTTRTMRRPQP